MCYGPSPGARRPTRRSDRLRILYRRAFLALKYPHLHASSSYSHNTPLHSIPHCANPWSMSCFFNMKALLHSIAKSTGQLPNLPEMDNWGLNWASGYLFSWHWSYLSKEVSFLAPAPRKEVGQQMGRPLLWIIQTSDRWSRKCVASTIMIVPWWPPCRNEF